jgi:hypothetical protein
MSLEREFASPPDEFSPFPFWFWNDDIREDELVRQIRDFRSKGIAGFVIHPRIGMPASIPYLGERFMALVRLAVETAASLGMRVVLYDEAMYPSGSAHGMVVARHPEFAAHSLRMERLPLGAAPKLLSGESIVASFDGIPAKGQAAFFIETASGGKIRGIHFGEDDGESEAPMAADILDPDAVAEFIRLTHDRYYETLAPWFGSTVIAMFTDEPSILGRGCKPDEEPWTPGFLAWYEERGGQELDLAALWLDLGSETQARRARFRSAVRERLSESYYRQLSLWCSNHGIALAGHPAESGDFGVEEHFQIPGQDMVWRWVDPDKGNALEGEHSVLARCSSDAARLWGRRRNANECFGCCGPIDNPWAFTAADMKWYLDWLLVRGVNLIFPHAFYYSVEGERRYGERPPDVGPNNIWWDDYAAIAGYIGRMCWLNTDSTEDVDIAVLAQDDRLPWRVCRELYRHQAGFHYLPLEYLDARRSKLYRVLLCEASLDPDSLKPSIAKALRSHLEGGGKLVVAPAEGGGRPFPGALYAGSPDEAAMLALGLSSRASRTEPQASELRVSHLIKEGEHFFMLVNEGNSDLRTRLFLPVAGSVERWDPWTGGIGKREKASLDGGIDVALGYRESLVLRVDPSRAPEARELEFRARAPARIGEAIVYEASVELDALSPQDDWLLDCGELGELARLEVNGRSAGSRLWKPYRFEFGDLLKPGANRLVLQVRSSLSGKYGRAAQVAGLVGPARLVRIRGS